jgi:hypothetical protein
MNLAKVLDLGWLSIDECMGVDIKKNQGPFWTTLALMMEPARFSEKPITF